MNKMIFKFGELIDRWAWSTTIDIDQYFPLGNFVDFMSVASMHFIEQLFMIIRLLKVAHISQYFLKLKLPPSKWYVRCNRRRTFVDETRESYGTQCWMISSGSCSYEKKKIQAHDLFRNIGWFLLNQISLWLLRIYISDLNRICCAPGWHSVCAGMHAYIFAYQLMNQ